MSGVLKKDRNLTSEALYLSAMEELNRYCQLMLSPEKFCRKIKTQAEREAKKNMVYHRFLEAPLKGLREATTCLYEANRLDPETRFEYEERTKLLKKALGFLEYVTQRIYDIQKEYVQTDELGYVKKSLPSLNFYQRFGQLHSEVIKFVSGVLKSDLSRAKKSL